MVIVFLSAFIAVFFTVTLYFFVGPGVGRFRVLGQDVGQGYL